MEENIMVKEALEKQKAEYEEKINALKLSFAVDTALLKAGAKNIRAAKALIDINGISFDKEREDRTVGLDEQIAALKANEESAFLFKDNRENSAKGFTPYSGESSDEDMGARTYSDFCEIYSN